MGCGHRECGCEHHDHDRDEPDIRRGEATEPSGRSCCAEAGSDRSGPPPVDTRA